jgi:hypothetical protein
MTARAALDQKVRHEFGEGGAPAEATTRVNLLREGYQTAGTTLTRMGYNGGMLDIKPPEKKEHCVPEGGGGGADPTPTPC